MRDRYMALEDGETTWGVFDRDRQSWIATGMTRARAEKQATKLNGKVK